MEHVFLETRRGTPLELSEFSRNLTTCQDGVSGSLLRIWVMLQFAPCWSLLHEVEHVSCWMSPTRA